MFKYKLYLNNAIFWAVASCRFCVNRRFGGTYRLHLQGRKIRERGASVSRWLQTVDYVGTSCKLFKLQDTFIMYVVFYNCDWVVVVSRICLQCRISTRSFQDNCHPQKVYIIST
jgi:hypothetical protein